MAQKYLLQNWIIGLFLIIAIGGLASDRLCAELPDNLVVNITANGRQREVVLHKYSIRAEDFRIRLWYQSRGYTVQTPPEITTYRGTVTDEPNTRVCAVIKPLTGLIVYAHAGKTPIWSLTDQKINDQPVGDPADDTVHDHEMLMDILTDGAIVQLDGDLALTQPSGYMPPFGPIQRAQMALDITNENLLTKYSGDWTEALADLEFTVNRYDDFMVRDVKMSFELTELVIRMDPFYDYEGSPLQQLRNHWSSEHSELNWDFAGGFITPKNWPSVHFGGVAYMPGKYFINVLFHENGHNLSAAHYLYGMDCMNGNRNAHWAALNAERIISRRNLLEDRFTDISAGEYTEPVHPYATPDLAVTLVNQPVEIDVLANDWDGNDDMVFVHSFTEITVPGGTVELVEGKLHYAPPQDYVGKDLIVYTIEDSTGLRNTDLVRIEVINGELAAYWELEETLRPSARSGTSIYALDASGHGHNGLLPVDYESVPGVFGKAVKIPAGSSMICDDSLILPSAPDQWVKPLWHSYPVEGQASNFFDPMDASFTLAFWFNATSFGSSEEPAVLFSKANRASLGYSITTDPNGIYFKIREWGGVYKTKELAWKNPMIPGIWYQVVMVINRNDDTLAAWIDGRRISNVVGLTRRSFICAGRTDLTMGGSTEVAFDDVQIFNKVFTIRDIHEILR